MNMKKSNAWERAPYDGVVGQSWHSHICELIGVITHTAQVKGLRAHSHCHPGWRYWDRGDVQVSLSPVPTEMPWHINAPGFTVYSTGPIDGLEKLLEMVRKA